MGAIQSIVGIILLGSFSVQAQDYTWKSRKKDEFDLMFETIERQKEKVVHEPKHEGIEKAPEPKDDPKPEVKSYKNLKSTPAVHSDGKVAKFDGIVVFSCANIKKKRFLFNKKQSDYCLIKDVKDAAKIAEKIGMDPFKKKFAVFETCPETANSQKACDPKRIRSF